MAILADLKDPRIRDVTVTYVEVSGDLRHAKVHVSVMGDETRQHLSLRGLQSAAGFLQARCAARINTRYTPKIEFFLDDGEKPRNFMVLKEVLPPDETPRPSSATSRKTKSRARPAWRRRSRRMERRIGSATRLADGVPLSMIEHFCG